MKNEILEHMRFELCKFNNDNDNAEDFLSTLVHDIENKFNVPCEFMHVETFGGGPGYEAISYIIVAFCEGKFLYDTLLKEWY